ILKEASSKAKERGGSIDVLVEPQIAAQDADIIYTDIWVSMGKEEESSKRLNAFKPYQVNSKLLKAAKKDVMVMHCLPAHRGEEITDEVMDGPGFIGFDQAENRLHVQKAILALLMGH
ncbi:MAG: ornithine carbamoyltransferase, partial [bacterium]